MPLLYAYKSKRNCSQVFCRIFALKNITKFIGEHLLWSNFFYEKDLIASVFLRNRASKALGKKQKNKQKKIVTRYLQESIV